MDDTNFETEQRPKSPMKSLTIHLDPATSYEESSEEEEEAVLCEERGGAGAGGEEEGGAAGTLRDQSASTNVSRKE